MRSKARRLQATALWKLKGLWVYVYQHYQGFHLCINSRDESYSRGYSDSNCDISSHPLCIVLACGIGVCRLMLRNHPCH